MRLRIENVPIREMESELQMCMVSMGDKEALTMVYDSPEEMLEDHH